ncbi:MULTISPECIES: GNAT family N-acetyltransferase [Kordiimonas]|jgi:RimJ/RimL family protein N-acetyltransferase|uniref:GNAT family N-acetyltransferase n=1 Tax=Kordiimonas TaxID=288021 RepID=UPI0025800A11|nr:GNAT family N-acetyltransferase [Kordiimonas sp. UBA4487]
MELKTDRLTLRFPAKDDAEAIQQALDDFDVVRMLQVVPYPYTLEMAHDFIGLIQDEWEKNASYIAAVIAPSGLVGLAGAHHWDKDKKQVELGYWFARKAWGNGYATEAAKAVCDFAFDHWPIDKIIVSVFDDNPASKRVVEKLGFKETGPHTIYSVGRKAEVSATWYDLART